MVDLFYLVCVSFGFMLGTFSGEKHSISSLGIFLLFIMAYVTYRSLAGG